MTPEVFLPNVLNNDKTGAFCTVFSPDLAEFYTLVYIKNVQDSGILSVMKRVGDTWSKPTPLPFSKNGLDNDLCLSYDGKRMFFRSWRELPDGTKPKNHSWLWFADKTSKGWSDAKPLIIDGKPIRSGYPSIAKNGTLYYAHRGIHRAGIYRAKLLNGKYQSPEFVFKVHKENIEGDMFIAPDESYMIIACYNHPESIGGKDNDLWIVFRKKDGSWYDAVNLSKAFNTEKGENCPQVSPDGKYFFYHRYDPKAGDGNLYWTDAGIIELLKEKVKKGEL
jgi:hypothetical protein